MRSQVRAGHRWWLRCATAAATLGLLIAVLPMGIVAAKATPVPGASTSHVVTKLDASTCSWWIASLKSVERDPLYGPQLRKAIPESALASITSDQCTLASSTTVQVSGIDAAALGVTGVAVSASMRTGYTFGYWANLGLYIGPWNLAQWHVDTGIQWLNPISYTVKWGPSCYLTTFPGYMGGWDQGGWCGVYYPQLNWTAQPGSNFWFSPAPLPLANQKRWGWMRYYAYADGEPYWV